MANIKDNGSVRLSALQKKMLPALSLPMPEECPTALRYALAKYDADDVAEAYEGLFALWQEGILED